MTPEAEQAMTIREGSGDQLGIPGGEGRQDHVSWVSEALSREFADRLDGVTIERVAAEEIAAFDEARVRDFIPILAARRARRRLWAWALRQSSPVQGAHEGERGT